MPITQSPFDLPKGPQVTPKTMNAAGQGGQQNPSYLQMRRGQTQPVVTPKPEVMGDTVGPKPTVASPPAGPPPAGPPQAGGQNLGDVYRFFKSDLENQRNQALANTRADASARGVFYGSPLTGSEADIHTQYLRGLGQFQSGMYGNEQQNQLARLGLASNLMWQNPGQQPPMPGPTDWSSLGATFASPSVAGQRKGPAVTPKPPVPNIPQTGGQGFGGAFPNL